MNKLIEKLFARMGFAPMRELQKCQTALNCALGDTTSAIVVAEDNCAVINNTINDGRSILVSPGAHNIVIDNNTFDYTGGCGIEASMIICRGLHSVPLRAIHLPQH